MNKTDNQIRARRESLGLRPVQVAAAGDLSVQHLINLEAGRHRPSLAAARRLARALRCSVDEIFPYAQVRAAAV